MNEKRFTLTDWHEVKDKGKIMTVDEVINMLNRQQDQISYWKHKVSSLLWILGQFDKAKVKELLKELEDE